MGYRLLEGPTALYLPCEYLWVPIGICIGNVDPFGIDPEQTVLVTKGLTSVD